MAPFLIGLNDRLRVVAIEEKRIIEVAVRPGTDIRSIQSGARELVPAGDLEFAVGIAAPIGQVDYAGLRLAGRGYDEISCRDAVLISGADGQPLCNPPLKFEIPRCASRVFERAGNSIDECRRTRNLPPRANRASLFGQVTPRIGAASAGRGRKKCPRLL